MSPETENSRNRRVVGLEPPQPVSLLFGETGRELDENEAGKIVRLKISVGHQFAGNGEPA